MWSLSTAIATIAEFDAPPYLGFRALILSLVCPRHRDSNLEFILNFCCHVVSFARWGLWVRPGTTISLRGGYERG